MTGSFEPFSVTGSYSHLGHHGKAGYKILFDKGRILLTNNVPFWNTNNNLVKYLQMCDTMDFEKIEEHNDLARQMENINKLKSTVNQTLPTNTKIIDEDVKAMMEDMPLRKEIDSVDTVSDAIVTLLLNVLTTLEPPGDESLCLNDSELIFYPNKGQTSGTEISEGFPESGFDGEQRDLSLRGEALRDLHSVSADATDLQTLSVGYLAERETQPPQETVTDVSGTHITATGGADLVSQASLASDCRGSIDDLGDASLVDFLEVVNYEVIAATPAPTEANSDIPSDAMERLPTERCQRWGFISTDHKSSWHQSRTSGSPGIYFRGQKYRTKIHQGPSVK